MTLTDRDKEELAEFIVSRLSGKQLTAECHAFTDEERQAIKDMVNAKKKAVKTALWLIGMLIIWVVKDIYLFIASHIYFNWSTR